MFFKPARTRARLRRRAACRPGPIYPGLSARRVAAGQGRAGFIALGRLDGRIPNRRVRNAAGAGAAGSCRGSGLAPLPRAVP